MKKWLFGLFLMLFAIMMYVPTAQAAETEDDFARKNFQTLYSDGQFKTESEDITVDTETSEDGIVVSGKNSDLSAEKIDMGTVDFEKQELQRIQLNAIGEKGKSTKVKLYLDGSDEATATFTLPTQSREGVWSGTKNVNVDVSDLGISGTHTVELAFCQYNRDGSAKESGSASAFFKNIQFVKQSIPVVSFDIDESLGTISAMNSDTDHNTQCYGNVSISVPDTYTCKYDNSYKGGTYELDYIKGRGNSTWDQEKKPYKIKLDNSEDLFGMGKDKNWALLANYCDNSLIHNGVTYAMGEDLNMEYNPQGVYVDVIMNGDYLGNYLLCENIRVDEQRVDIDSDTDFLLGAGSWGADDDAYLFKTENGATFNVNSPDSDSEDYSEKCEEIEAYMQRVENALLRRENPDTGKVEDPFDLIDIHSAAAYYWIQEMSNNEDFFETGSTYCYKKSDGKLYWGPLWDFDIAYDYTDSADIYFDGDDATENWNEKVYWFKLMLTFPEFTQELQTYWNETLYPEVQSVVADGGMIDQYTEQLAYSAANNYSNADYEHFCIEDVDEDEDASLDDFVLYTSTAEAQKRFFDETAKFKKELKARIEWCNKNLDSMAVDSVNVTFVVNGKTYATTTAYGGRYFTNIPKDPTCSDKNKVFGGWYVKIVDEDDGSTYMSRYSFSEYSDIMEGAQKKNGKYYLTLTAKFVDKSQDPTIQKVYFEQNSYRYALNLSKKTSYVIPFGLVPVYGNPSELTCSIANSDIATAKINENGDAIVVQPKSAGTTKVTLTTKKGTKFSVKITVVDNIASSNIDDHAIDEFKLSASKLNLTYKSAGHISIIATDPEDYLDIGSDNGRAFKWYSSNPDIYCIAGTVYANKVGTATIMCTDGKNCIKYCKVTITPKKSYFSKVKAGKKKITVKMSTKPSSKGGSTYQIAYRLKGSSKWHYKTTTKQSLAIKKLKSKKKYYVRVRAYKKVSGLKYYGSWSKKKLVKVK